VEVAGDATPGTVNLTTGVEIHRPLVAVQESATIHLKSQIFMSTRSLTIVGAILLTAWLAVDAMRGVPPISSAPSIAPSAAQSDPLNRQLAQEADGLWDRLRAAPIPRHPSRNPFTFAAAVAPRRPAPPLAEAAPVVEPEPVVPAVEPPPPLKLVGVAQNGTADNVTRTAIIAGLGRLFMVKVGEQVTARFTVAAIGPDVVELTDTAGGAPLRIVLK